MTVSFGDPFGCEIAEDPNGAPVPVFASFEELRAAIETEPTIVSTALLIQAVQTRLQRGEPFKGMTDKAIVEAGHSFQHPAGAQVRDAELLAWAHEKRAQHAYLRDALVKLEERAFGRIQRGLGAALACQELTKLEVEMLKQLAEAGAEGLPEPAEVLNLCVCGCAHNDVFEKLLVLADDATTEADLLCAAHKCGSYELAPPTPLADAYRFLAGPFIEHFLDATGVRARYRITAVGTALLKRVEAGQVRIIEKRQPLWQPMRPTDAQRLADVPSLASSYRNPTPETSPSIEAIFSDAAAFEREHAPQVGGDAAQPVRTVLGVTLGVLVENYGVDPRNLADYVREVLRFVHPAAFK